MQLTYNGVIIASEPANGGTDLIEGFDPQGKALSQWNDGLRASDATPIVRFNRQHTLTGIITPAPFGSAGNAMSALCLKFVSLPLSGSLVLSDDSTFFTFSSAVLQAFKTVRRNGVSHSLQVTFFCSP